METLSLTTEETKRYWRFDEDQFRASVLERAMQKSLALKADVVIQDADGFVLDRAHYMGSK